MGWVHEFFAWINDLLKPSADGISQLQAMPVYVVGAFVLGVGAWLWRSATARARKAKADRELEEVVKAAVREAYASVSSSPAVAKPPPEQLKEALKDILAVDAVRGRKTADLLIEGRVAEAGALARQIATDGEGALAQLETAAAEARKAAAQQWRHAATISFFSQPKDALQAYERARALAPSDLGIALEMAGLCLRLGRYKEAEPLYSQVLAEPAATPRERALATSGRGAVAQHRGDVPGADAFHRQAHAQMEALGDQGGQADELLNIGSVARLAGNFDVAEDCFSRAQAFYQASGNEGAVASALMSRGIIAGDRGASPDASKLYREAFAIYQRMEDRVGQASAWVNLGSEAWRRKELPEAEAAYKAALAIYKDLDSRVGEGQALLNVAEVYIEQNRLDEARPMLERADVLLKEAEAREGLFYISALFARIDWKQGQRTTASERWKSLLSECRGLGLSSVADEILRILACDGLTESSI
jgi:tetratricopeptide (TPR) repeat protein